MNPEVTERFLITSKSAKGKACELFIIEITKHY